MKILDDSLRLAIQLDAGRVPNQDFGVYAFMYERGRLISVGRNNMLVSSPKVLKLAKYFAIDHFRKFPTMHAEVDAISKLWGKKHLTGREKLVIIRLRRDGTIGVAKPCRDCHRILEALNFKEVWYTTESGWQKLDYRV